MTTMPSHNAEGHQTWNPSVGQYFEPASVRRESYAGIVGALQDQLAKTGSAVKSYPHNFAGIIAAIEDLTLTQGGGGGDQGPPVEPDVKPPGGSVIDGEWVWNTLPKDGTLWFDTRQGRLFIAIDNEYYQTNGADGLAQVTQTSTEPENPVVGQFWWDISTSTLYIFDGFWKDPEGQIKDNHQPGYTPVWRVVVSDTTTFSVNSDTLPLGSNSALTDSTGAHVQSEYNEWLYDSVTAIEEGVLTSAKLAVSAQPPANPTERELWYDITEAKLKVFYNGEWVETIVAQSYDSQIDFLNNQINLEQSNRSIEFNALNAKINSLPIPSTAALNHITQSLTALENLTSQQAAFNPSDYASAAVAAALSARVSTLETQAPDYALLMPRSEIEADFDALTGVVSLLPTQDELTAVAGSIPDVSSFVTQQDISTAISNITVDYLPRNGGAVDGSFIINKTSYNEPAFDFSQESWSSVNAFKFKTNSQAEETATFGTTEHAYEYAWNFSGNEDFCWVHGGNKVFSITSEGPACSTLILGDIVANNNDGRVMFNKVDVKQRLATYQSALEEVRQGVANATDFDSLKGNILEALSDV